MKQSPQRRRSIFSAIGLLIAFSTYANGPCVVQDVQQRFADRLERRLSLSEKGNFVEQPVQDIHALYALAQSSKSEFDRSLNAIAKENGVEALTAELKDMERSLSKAKRKLQGMGEAKALTDVLRGTLICDRLGQVELLKKSIKTHFADVKFKDRFTFPKENGYRDLQAVVLLRPSSSGEKPIWAEIQIHLRPLYEAKKKQGDALYRRWREIEEYSHYHLLTIDQAAELASLKAQEKQLYERVLSNILH